MAAPSDLLCPPPLLRRRLPFLTGVARGAETLMIGAGERSRTTIARDWEDVLRLAAMVAVSLADVGPHGSINTQGGSKMTPQMCAGNARRGGSKRPKWTKRGGPRDLFSIRGPAAATVSPETCVTAHKSDEKPGKERHQQCRNTQLGRLSRERGTTLATGRTRGNCRCPLIGRFRAVGGRKRPTKRQSGPWNQL